MTTIFDLDGTLLDHDGAALEAARAFHAAFSHKLGADFQAFLLRWQAIASVYTSAHAGNPEEDATQRRRRIRDVFQEPMSDSEADSRFSVYYEAYVASWLLYPDAFECVSMRSKLGPVGVITNGTPATQRAKLKKTGLEPLLAFAIISGEVGVAKPDPRIFHMAIQNRDGDYLFVGDSLASDVEGARNAGIPVVWLQRLPSRDKAPEGVRVIQTLREL